MADSSRSSPSKTRRKAAPDGAAAGAAGATPLFESRLSVPASCLDEEFPKFSKNKKPHHLPRSSSDRRMPRMLPPSSASLQSSALCKDNLWSAENREYFEMRFGFTMIPACKKKIDRPAGAAAAAAAAAGAEKAAAAGSAAAGAAAGDESGKKSHSPSGSGSDASSSIFSNGDSASFSSSMGSSFVKEESLMVVAKDECASTTAGGSSRVNAGAGGGEFIDFSLVGGKLVCDKEEDSSSSTSSSSSSDDEEQEKLSRMNKMIFPVIKKSWSSGSNWRLLRSYKNHLAASCSSVDRSQIGRKLAIASRFARSPSRFFSAAPKIAIDRETAPPPPPPAEIHCRPSRKKLKPYTSFFRRKSAEAAAEVEESVAAAIVRHAQLHCSVRHDHHSYTFVVEGCDELLVARAAASCKDESENAAAAAAVQICEFFTWRRHRRAWRRRPLEQQPPPQQPELVARMRLVQRQRGLGIRELEFVLLGKKNSSDAPQSHESGVLPSSWDDASQNNSDDEDILRQVWQHLEIEQEQQQQDEEELAAFVMAISPEQQQQKNTNLKNMVAILPAARHQMPENAAALRPLIQRWRSGGCCDCGSWDLGCTLHVLHHEAQVQLQQSPLSVALQGPGKQRDAVEIVALSNGLFSIKFRSPLVTPLQAFAAAVASLYSGASAAAPFLRRDLMNSRVPSAASYELAVAPWSKVLDLPYSSATHLERL